MAAVTDARATRALPLAWRKGLVGELWAEFFGCFILISFGDGVVAMPGDYGNVNTYFWIPIVGPLIGAALASFLYDFAIRDILKARRPPEPGIEAEGRTVQSEPGADL